MSVNRSNLHVFSELLLSGNKIPGSIPTSIKMLQNLKSLDLNNNHISSAIPAWSIEMTSSLVILDFSYNELTCNIPPDFGNHLVASLNLSFITDSMGRRPYLCKVQSRITATFKIVGFVPSRDRG